MRLGHLCQRQSRSSHFKSLHIQCCLDRDGIRLAEEGVDEGQVFLLERRSLCDIAGEEAAAEEAPAEEVEQVENKEE